jgi:hypothetical protein
VGHGGSTTRNADYETHGAIVPGVERCWNGGPASRQPSSGHGVECVVAYGLEAQADRYPNPRVGERPAYLIFHARRHRHFHLPSSDSPRAVALVLLAQTTQGRTGKRTARHGAALGRG